jgi:D-sedoheptulose 7-phosphate isomerase
MKKKINFNIIERYGKNMINVVKKIKIRFSSIVTFTGFDKNNNLEKIGDLAFFVDSKTYNMVENIHQMRLLSIVDCLANKNK